jgi:recombinational DNA repair ATPase RecF
MTREYEMETREEEIARIKDEVVRERDAIIAALKADAARLAEALRVAREHVHGNVLRSTQREWVGQEARRQLQMADAALDAHDAAMKEGGK